MMVREDESTTRFLKEFVLYTGNSIMGRDADPDDKEFKTLIKSWLVNPQSPLATDHPEFHMMRDMVSLHCTFPTPPTRVFTVHCDRRRSSPSNTTGHHALLIIAVHRCMHGCMHGRFSLCLTRSRRSSFSPPW
jgi:hypothetical protein